MLASKQRLVGPSAGQGRSPFTLNKALRVFALLTAALTLGWGTPATANEDFFEAAALGMGGAVRTIPVDTSSVHLNPATMVVRAEYLTSFGYQHHGREQSHLLTWGAVDSKTSNFALGTLYALDHFSPPFAAESDARWFPVDTESSLEDKRVTHRWDFAAAYAFLGRRLNVGLGGRVLRKLFDLYPDKTQFTMDAGFSAFPSQAIGLSVAVQNFIPTEDERFPVRVTGGVALQIEPILRVGVDVVVDITSVPDSPRVDLHAGVEGRVFGLLALRGGYYSDAMFRDHFACWGLGLVTERFRLSFGMRIQVGPVEQPVRAIADEAEKRLTVAAGIEVGF